ncbi:hypothetical protein M408DRAFT_20573 [Serendipita vermifera MAFF 305830]|uniref:DUF6533 domain-containing protein n=1 Tax=Serendipita vermifera MAFF 305830 TaxID=933852 RepID=A0A0C3BLC3_SERVB|nr:hypothetical protein M408DRAFT_20573 [Serendipita vermifera MAFF 305830]
MSITSENLRVVLKMLEDAAQARYLSGAAVTLVIYDWSLLFQKEYNTIWKSRWTLAKVLYYFIPLVSVPMLLTIAANNWLFTLRLVALYRHQRALVWFMYIFYACSCALTLTFLLLTLIAYGRIGVYYNPVAKCCFSTQTVPWTAAVFYTPGCYEFLIFTLTAYRAHKDAVLFNSGNTKLLVVLYRDNVIAFFIMLAMRSWNIWIHLTQPVSSIHLATNIYWATNTILSTRVYLNIVWAVRQPTEATSLPAGASLASGPSETYGGTPRIPMVLRRFPNKKNHITLSETFIEGDATFENIPPPQLPYSGIERPGP